jgi:hypothetical protein
MSIEVLPALAPLPARAAEPTPANPAVARCAAAYACVYRAELAKGEHKVSATFSAISAYRNAMPPLLGHENIRDFIACTAQGLLLGAIESSQCTKLLYAAQVALGALRSQPKPPKAADAS